MLAVISTAKLTLTAGYSLRQGNSLITIVTLGLSSWIHFLRFAVVSCMSIKIDSVIFFLRSYSRDRAVLWRWYVRSSRIRPLWDKLWWRALFFFLPGGVKSKPVREDRGTLLMFLNRFLRPFVHESCNGRISNA